METALFLPIISALFVLMSVGLFFLAFAYRRLVENFEHIQAHSQQEHSSAHQHADKLIESARARSEHIIQTSEKKAQDILINADFFTAASQQELGEKLAEATTKHLDEYEHMLSTFRSDLGKTFAAMSGDIQNGAQAELEAFRQGIQEETKRIQTEFATQLQKNYQVAEEEIANYKKMVIKKIDDQTHTIVKEVVQVVAPKLISNKDHETLVIEALKEAKQRHAI